MNQQAERAEIARILESGILGHATNLARMFQHIGEIYFENPETSIKEYTIAVEVFGRPLDFDPHFDPIVRVTAHQLRKRLREFYAAEGAASPLQIALPRGRYCLQFLQVAEPDKLPAAEPAMAEPSPSGAVLPAPQRKASRPWLWRVAAVVAVLLVAVVLCGFLYRMKSSVTAAGSGSPGANGLAAIPSGQTFRMLVGDLRAPFVDEAGNRWDEDRFCQGGSTFSVARRKIMGTMTPEIFLSGRKGKFHCSFPVPQGFYEVHLYFAETSGVEDASQRVLFSLNGGPMKSVDVTDFAGGSDVAVEKLIPGLEPGGDGKITLDLLDSTSYINAIELLPTQDRKLAPIRINIGDNDYKDKAGAAWISDRFFTGGRRSMSAFGEHGDQGMRYRSSRVGHFVYSVPVVANAKYTVKLDFVESWFGSREGENGVGRRLFDVRCNDVSLLKHFDVYAEAGREPLQKTFEHIEPNSLGKIDLEFIPIEDYAIVNGIEVIEE